MPPLCRFSDKRIKGDLALRAARCDDRDFAVERHERFYDRRHALQGLPGFCQVVRRSDEGLALAVITHPAAFDDCGPPDRCHRLGQIGQTIDRREIRRRNADRIEIILFDQPVLRDRQGIRRRMHFGMRRQEMGDIGRHVFEFVGDDIGGFGQLGKQGRDRHNRHADACRACWRRRLSPGRGK